MCTTPYQKYNFSINVFFIINFGPILKDLSQNFVFRHFPPFTIFAQLCKIIPCCISPHQKTELHKSSQSLICQVTQDHPGQIRLYIPPNPKYSSHCIGKSRQMIGLGSDKNYSTGHSINGNLAERKVNGERNLPNLPYNLFNSKVCSLQRLFKGSLIKMVELFNNLPLFKFT